MGIAHEGDSLGSTAPTLYNVFEPAMDFPRETS